MTFFTSYHYELGKYFCGLSSVTPPGRLTDHDPPQYGQRDIAPGGGIHDLDISALTHH
jgi:hypothetical protein